PSSRAGRLPRARPRAHAAAPTRGAFAGWHLLLIVAAAIAVYANSLKGVFLFDDFGAIVRNPQITDLWRLGAVFHPPAESPVSGRPIANLSFAINDALNGLNVTGYHVVNIGLHVLCACLLYALVRLTIARLSTTSLSTHASNIALAAALLWVVHPLTSEV